jgi:hypothetical protein
MKWASQEHASPRAIQRQRQRALLKCECAPSRGQKRPSQVPERCEPTQSLATTRQTTGTLLGWHQEGMLQHAKALHRRTRAAAHTAQHKCRGSMLASRTPPNPHTTHTIHTTYTPYTHNIPSAHSTHVNHTQHSTRHTQPPIAKPHRTCHLQHLRPTLSPIGHQHVLGLQIPVDHPVLVQELHRCQQLKLEQRTQGSRRQNTVGSLDAHGRALPQPRRQDGGGDNAPGTYHPPSHLGVLEHHSSVSDDLIEVSFR